MNYQPLLLIIDDEIAILKTLQDALEDEGFRVETLHDASSALDAIGQLIPDVVFLDIFIPNNNGIELLEKIKKEYPQQNVIMISGFGNIQIALEAIKKGAFDFIEKPLNLDEILSKINFLKAEPNATNHQDQKEQQDACKQFGIIGQSYLFRELMQQVNQVIPLKFPVLIYGQHGTGKSLIAHYMHHKGPHASSPYVEFNCAQSQDWYIVDTFFNNASGGTLYLKNINALESSAQKKLLTYFEHNNNNGKIIASSPIALFNLVRKEKFNESLFHKLNIIPLEIPPLSKRRYDIPLLVDHYLEQENNKQHKSVVFSTASIRLLRNHVWHGNVAELKHLIEKIVHLVHGDHAVITPQELQKHLIEKDVQFLEEQTFTQFNSLQEAVAEFEKKFLLYLLKKNSYDLNQMSDRLNLNIPQLRAKMLELSIELKG